MADSGASQGPAGSWFLETLDNWFTFQANFVMQYGWRMLGGLVVSLFFWNWLQPKIEAWKRAREDAAYHKESECWVDPDRVLAREEAVAKARAAQAERLKADSARYAELQKEKEEKKRREAAELLEKHGYVAGGRRLGTAEDGYLPLSGGGAGSSYRAPKRSACSGGGCGR